MNNTDKVNFSTITRLPVEKKQKLYGQYRLCQKIPENLRFYVHQKNNFASFRVPISMRSELFTHKIFQAY